MILEMILLFVLGAALLIGNVVLLLLEQKRIQYALNFVALLLLFVLLTLTYTSGAFGLYLGFLSITPFSLFFMLLFTLGMLLANMLFFEYADAYGSTALLASFLLLGLYIVASASSMFMLLIGLELLSMPMLFTLLLSKRHLEPATKMFVMAAVSVALFSFGMVLVYGSTGSFTIGASIASNPTLMIFAAIILIAALGFETSIFPFNVLVPDVYEGSPAYLTGVFGGINKKAGFAALIQVFILVFIAYPSAFLIVAVLSVLTMFYGNLGALRQKNLKRMLAYSSIAQSGYILIGVATYSSAGIAASLFQIFAHSIIFIGLFAIIAWLESRNKHTLDDITGLSRENALAAFALSLFLLSLVGLPFTTGFVGKLLIFSSAINSGLLILALLGILNSAISVYYYARPIMAAYSHDGAKRKTHLPVFVSLVIVTCLVITILFGLYPQPLINFVTTAAGQLFI